MQNVAVATVLEPQRMTRGCHDVELQHENTHIFHVSMKLDSEVKRLQKWREEALFVCDTASTSHFP